MSDILEKNVKIITMGENIKSIIYLIHTEIKILEKKISESKTDKERELYNAGVKYYKALAESLQFQLNEQI